jgi:hypothetical protein
MPAAFGGGNIDIRTRNIPDGPILDIEVGSGWNFESGNDTFRSSGGGDDWFGADDGSRALPAEISGAIQTYRGDVSTANILNTLRFDGPATLAEAQAINRQLATSLDATTGISESDVDADIELQTTLGNRFYLGDQEQ